VTVVQMLVLALIQGLTEFLPVSSSAHLILGSRLFDWPDQGLVFDVATHLGTLLAVLVYFRTTLADLIRAWLRPGDGADAAQRRRLGLYLVLASVPVIAVGALVHGLVESWLRDVRVIAVATLLFGVLLWFGDARFPRRFDLRDMDLKSGLLIGLAQVCALIPGASRSGVTITMGRMLGFNAGAAARFSFLLAIPVIAGAGAYGLWRMFAHTAAIDWGQFGLAVAASAVAGWVCIAAFLALLGRIGLLPFVLYRLALGGLLLVLSIQALN
jgi:undecaprenyl-diphosphatase